MDVFITLGLVLRSGTGDIAVFLDIVPAIVGSEAIITLGRWRLVRAQAWTTAAEGMPGCSVEPPGANRPGDGAQDIPKDDAHPLHLHPLTG